MLENSHWSNSTNSNFEHLQLFLYLIFIDESICRRASYRLSSFASIILFILMICIHMHGIAQNMRCENNFTNAFNLSKMIEKFICTFYKFNQLPALVIADFELLIMAYGIPPTHTHTQKHFIHEYSIYLW